MRHVMAMLALILVAGGADLKVGPYTSAQQPDPRQQPGAPITLYAPEQHDLYDGLFTISAGRIHMVGTLTDPPGWDHMDHAAATVRPVQGIAEIDVNEIANRSASILERDLQRNPRHPRNRRVRVDALDAVVGLARQP